jgi:hypothetical protein
MKNPLELSLLEIEAMMRTAGEYAHDVEGDFTRLLCWVTERQKWLTEYVVQKQAEQIREKKPDLSKRAARSIEEDLLNNAPVEFVDVS